MEEPQDSHSPTAENRAGQQNGTTPPTPTAPRRSGRTRKARVTDLRMGGADSEDELASSPPTRESVEEQPRRNPKRKAAPEVFDLPDDLLAAALAPVRSDELEDWEGWIELESDPSFFNVILRDLGVRDVKIQELFSVDEGSLAILPKPVHGLIFLYQYIEEDDQAATDTAAGVWFANQTTSNACATVALLNIIMNAQGVELGDNLQEFKSKTADLTPPLRGWLLGNNKWIRTIHNSFARRLDLLNADLALDNAVDESKKRTKVSVSRRKTKKKQPDNDIAYHFVAYVPVDGQVYQLDGLESEPLPIGEYADDWTAVVRPFIETRMLQYESEQLSFNLLALCHSPLSAIQQSLATTARSLADIDDSTMQQHISRSATPTSGPSPGAPTRALPGSIDRRRRHLQDEQAALRAEYVAELASVEEDERRVAARREDYTLAIHTWVGMLADKGLLKDLHEETRE